MALKAVLDSLDGVDDGLHDHYTEKDGKFVLQLDDFGKHPGAQTLKSTLNRVDKERQEVMGRLTEAETRLSLIPEGFDPEEYLSLKASSDPDKKKAQDEHLQSQRQVYEQKIANLQKKFETDMAKRQEEIAERDSYIDRAVRDAGLKDSLISAGVDNDYLDAAMALLKPSVKVRRAETGDRSAIVETELGEVDVPSFVKDWSQTKGRKFLAKATGPEARGSGAHGGNSKVMKRAEFNKLDPAAQNKAISVDKYTLID